MRMHPDVKKGEWRRTGDSEGPELIVSPIPGLFTTAPLNWEGTQCSGLTAPTVAPGTSLSNDKRFQDTYNQGTKLCKEER